MKSIKLVRLTFKILFYSIFLLSFKYTPTIFNSSPRIHLVGYNFVKFCKIIDFLADRAWSVFISTSLRVCKKCTHFFFFQNICLIFALFLKSIIPETPTKVLLKMEEDERILKNERLARITSAK